MSWGQKNRGKRPGSKDRWAKDWGIFSKSRKHDLFIVMGDECLGDKRPGAKGQEVKDWWAKDWRTFSKSRKHYLFIVMGDECLGGGDRGQKIGGQRTGGQKTGGHFQSRENMIFS